jgi:hypothetical protein
MHCESLREFCAELNGYNDRPTEHCVKCSKANEEVRLGADTCHHWDGNEEVDIDE